MIYDFVRNNIEANGESIAYKVLRFIRRQGTTSQTEIVKHFGLSKAAVSEAVQKLMSGNYIQEDGMSDSSRKGGRRRVLLKFNPLSGLVVGINIKISCAYLALSDLNANIYKRKVVKFKRKESPEEVIPKIQKAVIGLLKTKPEASGELVGIGIGVPGIIHYSSGTLVVADTLSGWEGISISSIFESYFKVPVFVENDVKTITIAEYLFGIAKGVRNFILLWIGNGIGAGIMVDGRLMRGANSSAGEIGYNDLGFCISDKNEFPLLYSSQRDFGDILSEDSIVDAYTRASGRSAGSIEDIHKLLIKDDKIVAGIFNEIGKLIGIIGIMLANTLNPEMIVLGGNVVHGNPLILKEVSQFLKKDILSAPVENVKIDLMKNKKDEVLLGAIGLILYELFEPQFPKTYSKLRVNNKNLWQRNSLGIFN